MAKLAEETCECLLSELIQRVALEWGDVPEVVETPWGGDPALDVTGGLRVSEYHKYSLRAAVVDKASQMAARVGVGKA